MRDTVCFFPGSAQTELAESGGKGLSLIEGTNAGLPVPEGFVLTVSFFEPWLLKLKHSAAWKKFLNAERAEIEHACTELKHAAGRFHFTEEQESLLRSALSKFPGCLFAVRSSSPHEDLEGASFAGGYETVLGVNAQTMAKAVNHCFQSLFDYRVYAYMKANGLDATDLKIAVVVQRQVASEISGVGFSLNPISNNYDEAVFNANWGLGETVVSGVITPDTFIVDKVAGTVRQATVGSKGFSMWLLPVGGTERKTGYRSDERTLSDVELIELTELVKKVEAIYEKPMDIEWAYEKDKLYLLQARPITTYVPLAPEMLTKPGEKKRLYFDVTVTAQAMNQPLTKMGTSLFIRLIKVIGRIAWGRDISRDFGKSIPWISDGKIYVNVSNVLALVGKKRFLTFLNIMDPLGAKTLNNLDESEYSSNLPHFLLVPFGLVRRLPGIYMFIRRARKDPDGTHAWVMEELKTFEREAREIAQKKISLGAMFEEMTTRMFYRVFRRTVPLTFYSRGILKEMTEAVGNDPRGALLERALPNNVTIEMGLSLARVAAFLPEHMDNDKIREGIEKKSLPANFLAAWQNFIDENGFRGPAEIDAGSPRYSDDSRLLIDLLISSRKAGGESPEAAYERNAGERERAFQELYAELRQKDKKAAERFADNYRFFKVFGGYRETHKKYLVFVVGIMRQKLVEIGRELVMAGRLDRRDQIFDLTVEQIDNLDDSMDLRKLSEENTRMIRRLKRILRPPTLIDSRGFIPRAPRPPVRAGEVAGEGVSVGRVQGRIKVLHRPDEKPLLKGEILVARATDPGWTPLFVNAGGIILEIGGSLQHGALVAREYGIPCVTGIENATTLWRDGILVEVDGSAGVVRTIDT